jgi:hypothetical protein
VTQGKLCAPTRLALSELLIAHESIESFLDEMESSNAEELMRQRDRSTREFRDGLAVSRERSS